MKKLRNLSRIDVFLFIGFSVLLGLLFIRTNSDNGENSSRGEMSIWPIVITIAVISIIIYFILKKNIPKLSKKDSKGDATEKIKIDKDKVPSFKTNARWSSVQDWIVRIVAVIAIGCIFMYFHDKNVFGSHSTGNKGAMRVEHLSPNGLRLTLDRRYLYNFYPDESTVFKSFNHPDGDIVDTLIKNPDNTWRWANQYHNNGWDKWEVSSIEGDHTIKIDSIPRNNIAR